MEIGRNGRMGFMAGIALMTFSMPGLATDRLVSAQGASVCLGDRGGSAVLGACADSVAEFSGYGEIRSHGRCLTSSNKGAPLSWSPCANRPAQRWAIAGNGLLRNEAGWCADAERQGRSLGTRVIAWDCQSTAPSNQRWSATTHQAGTASTLTRRALTEADVSQMLRMNAHRMTLSQAMGIVAQGGGNLTLDRVLGLISQDGGSLIGPDGAAFKVASNGNLIGQDGSTFRLSGGQIVAAGAGNLVAQGGGNLVAQGGGNLVAQGGGNIVAQGGGNAVGNGNAPLVAQGGGNIVAQGGGNAVGGSVPLVAQGGGNIVAQGGGNLVAQGGGNIVAQGGGNAVGNGNAPLVAQGGGNLVAQGGGNIVAQGGGNAIPPGGAGVRAFTGTTTPTGAPAVDPQLVSQATQMMRAEFPVGALEAAVAHAVKVDMPAHGNTVAGLKSYIESNRSVWTWYEQNFGLRHKYELVAQLMASEFSAGDRSATSGAVRHAADVDMPARGNSIEGLRQYLNSSPTVEGFFTVGLQLRVLPGALRSSCLARGRVDVGGCPDRTRRGTASPALNSLAMSCATSSYLWRRPKFCSYHVHTERFDSMYNLRPATVLPWAAMSHGVGHGGLDGADRKFRAHHLGGLGDELRIDRSVVAWCPGEGSHAAPPGGMAFRRRPGQQMFPPRPRVPRRLARELPLPTALPPPWATMFPRLAQRGSRRPGRRCFLRLAPRRGALPPTALPPPWATMFSPPAQ